MSFMKPKAAAPLPPIPPPPNAPTLADSSVAQAGMRQRNGAQGLASTIATSPQGLLSAPSTTGKSLLGQ